jgi:hypothetical protein
VDALELLGAGFPRLRRTITTCKRNSTDVRMGVSKLVPELLSECVDI